MITAGNVYLPSRFMEITNVYLEHVKFGMKIMPQLYVAVTFFYGFL
jgi:hypothetical protein